MICLPANTPEDASRHHGIRQETQRQHQVPPHLEPSHTRRWEIIKRCIDTFKKLSPHQRDLVQRIQVGPQNVQEMLLRVHALVIAKYFIKKKNKFLGHCFKAQNNSQQIHESQCFSFFSQIRVYFFMKLQFTDFFLSSESQHLCLTVW